MSARRVAVLVPCRNEAATVARVVADFRSALPDCIVYVYDNGSTDGTGELARIAGAKVRREERPGKGVVVRRMFGEVDADVYLLVDGDATYDAKSAPKLVAALIDGDLDMVTAIRDDERRQGVYRRGHRTGNHVFNALLGAMFGARPADMLSGYRALSRRFVKSYPATSRGFEVETELTVHALEQRVPTGEIATPYFPRPEGSTSKLSTWRDGTRILWTAAMLFRDEKPLVFFSGFACIFGVVGLLLGGGDWRTWLIALKTAPDGKVLSAVGIGSFLGAVVDFVIIAFCVFLITRALLKEPPPPPGLPMKTCPACGESVLARATRCRYCTSPV